MAEYINKAELLNELKKESRIMANKIKGNINLPQAEETSLNTMFQGTGQTARVPRERRTKHKDVSMTPTTFAQISSIAKSKGFSLNDYINLLIEEEIGKEIK